MVVAGDGRPRLFVLRGARVGRDESLAERHLPTSTVEEIPGYVWDERRPEVPVKDSDHGCDALRYVVMHREVNRGARLRWVG